MHFLSKRQFYIMWFVALCCVSCVRIPESNARTNIALDARYTFSPVARYEHTVDPTDARKLTDGKFSTGFFWTCRAQTVGWLQSGTIRIDIDLENSFEIYKVGINTARGNKADVSFPSRVDIFASADGEHYGYLGDLLQGKDTSNGPYLVSKFELPDLKATARFLTLFIVPNGNYTFVDEIEVFGEKSSKHLSQEHPIARVQLEPFQRDLVSSTHQVAVLNFMLKKLIADFQNSEGSSTAKSKDELSSSHFMVELARDGTNLNPHIIQKYKDMLFAMHANFLKRRFKDRLLIWHVNPWSAFTPIDSPQSEDLLKSEIVLDVLQGGTASDAICLTNSGKEKKQYKIVLKQSDINGVQPKVSIREAVPVSLADDSVKTDPLVTLASDEISLHEGESKQIWITASGASKPGFYDAKLQIKSATDGATVDEVRLRIHVFSAALPSSQELQVNAWSYLNWRPIKQVTQQAAVDLRDHHINIVVLHPSQIPWPKNTVSPFGVYYNFDKVLTLHQGASKFLIYLEFKNEKLRKLNGTAEFMSSEWQNVFKKWIVSLVAHMKSLGLGYEEFAFYPLDEPQNEAEVKIIIDVARLLNEVDSSLQVYSTIDSVDRLKHSDYVSLINEIDIIQISDLDLGKERQNLLSTLGKTIWTYGAQGGKKADPFALYRLQAWRAFKYGVTGIGFWAYADTGTTGTAWNDLDGTRPDFAVIYEGEDSIISSKRWEAWREGVEDYELLVMARKKLSSGAETKEFEQRVLQVVEHPGDHQHFKETRQFLLNIVSR